MERFKSHLEMFEIKTLFIKDDVFLFVKDKDVYISILEARLTAERSAAIKHFF